MDANGRELIFRDEVHAIVSCAIEVINGIGNGLHEKPYENAMAVEFQHRGIPFLQQARFPVQWRGVMVGEFVPDLLAYEQIIVETKNIDRITSVERGQVLNHLRISGLQVGVILNFKNRKLEWERIVLSPTTSFLSYSRPFASIRG